MSSQPDNRARAEEVIRRISTLLNDLSPANLALIEQLVEQLRHSNEANPAPYTYPTVVNSADSLIPLTGLLRDGYAGDALADTEALYDE
jgi:hypothetical protein